MVSVCRGGRIHGGGWGEQVQLLDRRNNMASSPADFRSENKINRRGTAIAKLAETGLGAQHIDIVREPVDVGSSVRQETEKSAFDQIWKELGWSATRRSNPNTTTKVRKCEKLSTLLSAIDKGEAV